MFKKLSGPILSLYSGIMLRRRERFLSKGKAFVKTDRYEPTPDRRFTLGSNIGVFALSAFMALPVAIGIFASGAWEVGISWDLFFSALSVDLHVATFIFGAFMLCRLPYELFRAPNYHTRGSSIIHEALEVSARIRVKVSSSAFLKEDSDAQSLLYSQALVLESLVISYSEWLEGFSPQEYDRVQEILRTPAAEDQEPVAKDVKAVRAVFESFNDQLDLIKEAESKLIAAQEAFVEERNLTKVSQELGIEQKSSAMLSSVDISSPVSRMQEDLSNLEDVTLARRTASDEMKEYVKEFLPEVSF